MESNGKRVDLEGKELKFKTAGINFGVIILSRNPELMANTHFTSFFIKEKKFHVNLSDFVNLKVQ